LKELDPNQNHAPGFLIKLEPKPKPKTKLFEGKKKLQKKKEKKMEVIHKSQNHSKNWCIPIKGASVGWVSTYFDTSLVRVLGLISIFWVGVWRVYTLVY